MSGMAKEKVAEYWQAASCGEDLYLLQTDRDGYRLQSEARYQLEPYILPFMEPERWRGKRVLEIGVGLGADHQRLVEAGAETTGLDLTERAVEHARHRMHLFGLTSTLIQGDAEELPFADASFDLVFSYGVIHHTPHTAKAAAEIMRVLKPGGTFKVMIYSKWNLVGLMLWMRYGIMAGKPWRSIADIYAHHLESPGTKGYTIPEAKALFPGAIEILARVQLNHADLLSSGAGQRHAGPVLMVARRLWPRWLLKRIAGRLGSHLLIEGSKELG